VVGIQIVWPEFVSRLPDLQQTNSGMEPVVDGERHADVGDNRPGPHSVELEVRRPKLGPVLLEAVDGPHGQVGHQQEGDQLASRLAPHLRRVFAAAPPGVQDEDGLAGGLHQRDKLGEEAAPGGVGAEVAAHDGEEAVDVHASLRHHDQDAVQRQAVGAAAVLEAAHLQHAHQHGNRRRRVQSELAHGHLKHVM